MCRIHTLFKHFNSAYSQTTYMRNNWFKMAMFQLLFIFVIVVQICDSNSHQTKIEDAIMKKVKQYVEDRIKSVKSQVKALLIILLIWYNMVILFFFVLAIRLKPTAW